MWANRKFFFFIIWIFVTEHKNCAGQVLDDFSDGDLVTNPSWNCDSSKWKVESGKLRSANTVENLSFFISTPSYLVKETEWQLEAELQFNTSSLNYVDIFLVSDDLDLMVAKNGYFVRIGGTKDEICLYKRTNGINYLLIDGVDGSTNKSSTLLFVKVKCDANFEWTLTRSLTGNAQDLVSEGTATDSSISNSSCFGICVTQSTSSFSGKHFFDNVSVQQTTKDTLCPSVLSVNALTERKIQLQLNEEITNDLSSLVDLITVTDTLSNAIKLDSIRRNTVSENSYLIFLSQDLDGKYKLTCNALKDLAGNVQKGNISLLFQFYKPKEIQYKDILFSELLPDPSPVVGLPDAEFIELYNNSRNSLDLKGIQLSDQSLTVFLPSYNFPPNTYLILCHKEDSVAFSQYGPVLASTNLPSLNNAGDQLSLRNVHGTLVDKVSYSTDWYKDKNKENGGYSLELIDPKDFCRSKDNWTASINPSGGSPGQSNSVLGHYPDTVAPSIAQWKLLSPSHFTITFSEAVDSLSLSSSNFELSNDFSITSILWKSDSLDKALFELNQALPFNLPLTLKVKNLKDCPGNASLPYSTTLVRPATPSPHDLLINELLFNPRPYGVDFVELYNNSPNYIDLDNISLASMEDDSVVNKKQISPTSHILGPHEYIAITINKTTLLNNYPKGKSDRILQAPSLPTYGDNSGSVILISSAGQILDRFDYDASMQSPLLPDKEGVSLEKTDPRLPSNDPNNWMSASKEVGYATPGYQNSQILLLGIQEETVTIEPTVITPNGDGDRDFLLIQLQTDQIARLNTVIIYDAVGREVKRLIKNQFGGAQTHVQWDGTNEQQEPVALGHYVIWVEMLDKEGKVVHAKKKAVVGEKF